MREIKFRAWDKENKIMIKVCSLSKDEVISEKRIWDWFGEQPKFPRNDTSSSDGSAGNIFPLNAVDLMQYTGLKDKNNRDIYEGDILKNISLTPKIIGEVCFGISYATADDPYCCGQGLGFYFKNKKDSEMLGSSLICTKGSDFEIIGNIYENPELLK